MELAAELFGAHMTWFLVNGSTSGILTAILATCKIYEIRNKNTDPLQKRVYDKFVEVEEEEEVGKKDGEKTGSKMIFLVARNSHKSVFDALKLVSFYLSIFLSILLKIFILLTLIYSINIVYILPYFYPNKPLTLFYFFQAKCDAVLLPGYILFTLYSDKEIYYYTIIVKNRVYILTLHIYTIYYHNSRV